MKLIKQGEIVPFGYGLVGIRADYGFDVAEFRIIPLNFLYRFWYWTMKNTQLPQWQKHFIDHENEVREKAFKHGHDAAMSQAFNNIPEEIKRKILLEGMAMGIRVQIKEREHSQSPDAWREFFEIEMQETLKLI